MTEWTRQTMADLILLIFCLLNNRQKSGLIGKIVFLMKIMILNIFFALNEGYMWIYAMFLFHFLFLQLI